MLPFLKKAQEGGVSGPVEHVMREPDEEDDDSIDSLAVAAHDIMQAIKRDDAKSLTSSLKAFVELCDSEPDYQEEPNG